MTRPNFFIIGASKCGTTSLYHYLQQHPQIFMCSPKEPHYFVYEGIAARPLPLAECHSVPPLGWPVKTLSAYEALFAQAQDAAIALGESSVSYLAFPKQVIPVMKKYTPYAKLIAILRQPAERAFSAYLNLARIGMEPIIDFREIYELEHKNRTFAKSAHGKRDFNSSFYFKDGFYFAQLNEYSQVFPRQRIKVYLYDDLKRDPMGIMRDMLSFLEVDDTFKPDFSQRYNTALWPRSRFLNHVLHIEKLTPEWLQRGWGIRERLKRLNYKPPPRLDPVLRQQLTEHYREDIVRLQDLIGRDLSHWLASPAEP